MSTSGLDAAIFSQEVGTWGSYNDTTLSKAVGYWLVKVTERNSDNTSLKVSAMLLGSEEEAASIKARLAAGEDFDTLAKQYSQNWSDTDGAAQGTITSTTTAAYKTYVFDTASAIGAVSDPIKDTAETTKGGYWLFKVLSSTPNQNVTTDDTSSLTNKAMAAWLKTLEADTAHYKVTNSLTEKQKTFIVNWVSGG